MTCYYSVEAINLPKGKLDEVKRLLKEYDLTKVFAIQDEDLETPWIALGDSMSWSTASTISDDFFPALAKILKDTAQDGQLIETECDCEKDTAVIAGGEVRWLGHANSMVHKIPDVTLGEAKVVPLDCEVIGLGGGRVVIVKIGKEE